MGYVNNSPVKQIWLPIEYSFITDRNGNSFKDFSIDYKNRYGIDLHDVFSLYKDDEGSFTLCTKNDLTGAYLVDGLYGEAPSKFAVSSAIPFLGFRVAQEAGDGKGLAVISVEDRSSNAGNGFRIVLPATGTLVTNIDDLIVEAYEI